MGGDGGVIASNRRYMRGAGTADHTADSNRASKSETQTLEREDATERMRTCAITKNPLPFGGNNNSSNNNIVACPYGRLYNKEAAVEALLRRKASKNNNDSEDIDELGSHIRGLKDLYPVRFSYQATKDNKKSSSSPSSKGVVVPVCPITGQELNGTVPAILIHPGNLDNVNVLSQRAVKEMGWDSLQDEYGPMEEKIRLAPPPAELVEIQQALEEKRQLASSNKKKKDKKKRKKEKFAAATTTTTDNSNSTVQSLPPPRKVHKASLADVAATRVQTSVKNNEVLSSIFTTSSSKTNSMSQKERNDHLFARS